MFSRIFQILIVLIGGCVFANPLISTGASAEPRIEITDSWSIAHIWKDAQKGLENFYEGKVGLKNIGTQPIEAVRVQITIFDPAGNKIDASDRIDFGTLRPGQSETRPFLIKKGIQYGELKLDVTYTLAGVEKKEEFSTPDETRPTSSMAGQEGAGLKLLSYELDQPFTGSKKKKSKATFSCRVKNLDIVPALNPTVILTFPKGKTVEIPLEKGAIPPGETRTYRDLPVKDLPPDPKEMTVTLRATWKETKQEGEVFGPESVPEGEIGIGPLSITEASGKKTVVIPIVNNKEDLPEKTLVLEILFLDKNGKTVKKISHRCQESFPMGKLVTVTLTNQILPGYESYQVSAEIPEIGK